MPALLLTAACLAAPPAGPDAELAGRLATFDAAALTAATKPHPRVLFTADRVAAVKSKAAATPWAADLLADLTRYADDLCDPARRERNPPDWKVQSGLPKRVTALALLFKLTGDRKYLDQADAELRELCRQPAFVAQNEERRRPGLPEASGVTGLAYGYDALRDALPPDTVREVEETLLAWVDRRMYEEDGSPRDAYANNWTHVIWGGTVVAAVALADRYPERCARVIRDGVPRCKAVADIWGPDGVSPEGTHYWDFGAHRYFGMLDSLQTGLGTDFGLADDPLLDRCARWRIAARGPAGDFPYGDGDRRNFSALPLAYWAGKTGRDWLVNTADLRLMARDRGSLAESKLWLAQTLVWLPADAVDGTPPADLRTFAGRGGAGGGDTSGEAINKHTGPAAVGGAGDIVNVLHRTSWNPGALWLGAVGGTANVSHGHMHAGSFCLDAGLGESGEPVRWVTEVDAHHYDSYRDAGLELWTWTADLPPGRRAPGRDAVYAWGSRGHNTLTVDGRVHDARGVAPLTDYAAGNETTTAAFDLLPVLNGPVPGDEGRPVVLTAATRTFRADDAGLTVTDRWTAADGAATVTARVHTTAAVDIAPDGRSMTWTKDGRTLRVTLKATDPDAAAGAVPLPGVGFAARPAGEGDGGLGPRPARRDGRGRGRPRAAGRAAVGDGAVRAGRPLNSAARPPALRRPSPPSRHAPQRRTVRRPLRRPRHAVQERRGRRGPAAGERRLPGRQSHRRAGAVRDDGRVADALARRARAGHRRRLRAIRRAVQSDRRDRVEQHRRGDPAHEVRPSQRGGRGVDGRPVLQQADAGGVLPALRGRRGRLRPADRPL